MTEQPESPVDTPASSLPAWLQPDWDGPAVELRPADADSSWPEGAHHRVRFERKDFPQYRCWPAPTHIYSQHFTADGWPLEVPADIRPQLDARAREFFHRAPWSNFPQDWRTEVVLTNFADMDDVLDLEAAIRTRPRGRPVVPPPL